MSHRSGWTNEASKAHAVLMSPAIVETLQIQRGTHQSVGFMGGVRVLVHVGLATQGWGHRFGHPKPFGPASHCPFGRELPTWQVQRPATPTGYPTLSNLPIITRIANFLMAGLSLQCSGCARLVVMTTSTSAVPCVPALLREPNLGASPAECGTILGTELLMSSRCHAGW